MRRHTFSVLFMVAGLYLYFVPIDWIQFPLGPERYRLLLVAICFGLASAHADS